MARLLDVVGTSRGCGSTVPRLDGPDDLPNLGDRLGRAPWLGHRGRPQHGDRAWRSPSMETIAVLPAPTSKTA
jgi:hypothetical protein